MACSSHLSWNWFLCAKLTIVPAAVRPFTSSLIRDLLDPATLRSPRPSITHLLTNGAVGLYTVVGNLSNAKSCCRRRNRITREPRRRFGTR
jgi:hypothetical protein